jgi:hypothetical protein
MVDHRGEIYDGDKLLYVIACARHAEGRLDGVVGTLMSNLGFEHAIGRLGAPFARAKVGDRYVLELLQERGWKLGGENSGHIICLDRHTTGDGIVSALQVLAALKQRGLSLADACADLVFYPQRLINVRMPAGFDWRADGGDRDGAGEGGADARRERARAAASLRHRAPAARDGGRPRWRAGRAPRARDRRRGRGSDRLILQA